MSSPPAVSSSSVLSAMLEPGPWILSGEFVLSRAAITVAPAARLAPAAVIWVGESTDTSSRRSALEESPMKYRPPMSQELDLEEIARASDQGDRIPGDAGVLERIKAHGAVKRVVVLDVELELEAG